MNAGSAAHMELVWRQGPSPTVKRSCRWAVEGTSYFVRRNTVPARHQHQTSTQPHRGYSCRHIASTLAVLLTPR